MSYQLSERLCHAIDQGLPFAIITDFDGTVALHDHATKLDMMPTVWESLAKLAESPFAFPIVASARPLENLAPLGRDIPRLTIIANDGEEIFQPATGLRFRNGDYPDFSVLEAEARCHFLSDAGDVQPQRFGYSYMIAVDRAHKMRGPVVRFLQDWGGRLAASTSCGWRVAEYSQACVLEKANKRGKAAAVDMVMHGFFGTVLFAAAYAGDGANDVDAQRLVKEAGGFAVLVQTVPALVSDTSYYNVRQQPVEWAHELRKIAAHIDTGRSNGNHLHTS